MPAITWSFGGETYAAGDIYKVLLSFLDSVWDESNNRVLTSASLVAGDIEIGAVEIKNATDDTRAKVKSDGTDNALVVVQNSPPDATYIGDIKFGEALPAGSAIIGKAGIDQTTPGTTDSVSVATGQGAGATIGATADAAVITDTTGTLSGKLRGLVKWAFERMPAALGQTTKAGSLPVTIASDQGSLGTVDLAATLGSATAVVPTQITKTVAATGTPEALAADGTFFRMATVIGKKAARTNNTGIVYLGIGATNDTQPFEINPGESVRIEASPGTKIDLNDLYLDVLNNGDGVVVIYS